MRDFVHYYRKIHGIPLEQVDRPLFEYDQKDGVYYHKDLAMLYRDTLEAFRYDRLLNPRPAYKGIYGHSNWLLEHTIYVLR